jgi:hypothetical protein
MHSFTSSSAATQKKNQQHNLKKKLLQSQCVTVSVTFVYFHISKR